MKVNGYQIRAAIKRREVALQVAIRAFEESLYYFGEDKPDIFMVMERVSGLEHEIADLQTVQARYNLLVGLSYYNFNGEKFTISLTQAVKLVGGLGRGEKLWRSALPKKDRYSVTDRVPTRQAEDEHARLALSYDELISTVDRAAQVAANLRAAIAAANNSEVEVEGLSPDML